jgi:hypothetical protein
MFTYADLMELELDSRNDSNQSLNYFSKGSRFAHIENLQNEVSDNDSNNSMFTGTSEQVSVA